MTLLQAPTATVGALAAAAVAVFSSLDQLGLWCAAGALVGVWGGIFDSCLCRGESPAGLALLRRAWLGCCVAPMIAVGHAAMPRVTWSVVAASAALWLAHVTGPGASPSPVERARWFWQRHRLWWRT
jgi:hypothetical protein